MSGTRHNRTARRDKKPPLKHKLSASQQGTRCQKCGNRGSQKILITKHHLYPLRDKPEEKLIIYLCEGCHKDIERVIEREERVLCRRLTIDECNQLTIYFLSERDERVKLPKKASQLESFLQHKRKSFLTKLRKLRKDILVCLDDASQSMVVGEKNSEIGRHIDELKKLVDIVNSIDEKEILQN